MCFRVMRLLNITRFAHTLWVRPWAYNQFMSYVDQYNIVLVSIRHPLWKWY